ncbi:MAG: hypothetical protein ACRDKU_02015 [Gaiellaceae bacterium]
MLGTALASFATAIALFALTTRSEAETVSSTEEVAALEARLASVERDARFWRQLTSAFVPGKTLGLSSMSDHSLRRTPGGPVLALHFDNMNLEKAANLNWVAFALPGRFTRADQARVNRLYGPGFTHFHSFKSDAHGGPAGTKGVWFVHIGTRTFRSPFGQVRSGRVDLNFMPTKPPAR